LSIYDLRREGDGRKIVALFLFAWGPTCFERGGDPTPAAVARRMRASQQLKAVTR